MKTSIPAKAAMLTLAALFLTVGMANAEVFRYRLGGAWDLVTDGTGPGWGLNPNNDGTPGTMVPGAGDEARINWPTPEGNKTTLEYDAPELNRVLIGVDEEGTLEVNDGGVLTVTQDLIVGNNGFTDGNMMINDGAEVNVGNILWVARGGGNDFEGDIRGFLDINSGAVVNVGSHLWWGIKGPAEVNIAGTLNQTGGILGLGTSNAVDPSGDPQNDVFATVSILDGGVLALNNIHAGGTQSSIQPGSVIDIETGGRLTLPGNFVDVLQGYEDAGRIIGNGLANNVDIFTETIGGSLDGDYNDDGEVNAADYTIWRNNLGDDSAALMGNGTGAATVVAADYDLWRSNYGGMGDGSEVITVVTASAAGVGASAVIPEPSSILLAGLLGIVGLAGRRQRGAARA